MSKAIFIYRRDLRVLDNTSLLDASRNHDVVLPIFIFTKEQLIDNPFKSDNCVQFMMSCLELLNKDLKKLGSRLFYFFGNPVDVLDQLLDEFDYSAVYVNEDYTPYSIERDSKIEKFCKKNKIDFCSNEDVLLNPIGSIRTNNDKLFNKFGKYYEKASKIKVREPDESKIKNFISGKTKFKSEFKEDIHQFYEPNPHIHSLADPTILDGIVEEFDTYNRDRDTLSYETTHLSAYIKFGQVSIRQVHREFSKLNKNSSVLMQQLYWRDLFYNIGYEYGHVFTTYGNAREKFDKFEWPNDDSYFMSFANGCTGYPIIDSSIKQLLTTSYMHNRGRLLVANFLIKVLHNDWKRGERFFAQNLIDYDPCVNSGNWGWMLSGIIQQSIYIVFNPSEQSKKHDPDCIYIKKWIPQLKDVPSKHIHNWQENWHKYANIIDYPRPIVDFKVQKEKWKKMYAKFFAENK